MHHIRSLQLTAAVRHHAEPIGTNKCQVDGFSEPNLKLAASEAIFSSNVKIDTVVKFVYKFIYFCAQFPSENYPRIVLQTRHWHTSERAVIGR